MTNGLVKEGCILLFKSNYHGLYHPWMPKLVVVFSSASSTYLPDVPITKIFLNIHSFLVAYFSNFSSFLISCLILLSWSYSVKLFVLSEKHSAIWTSGNKTLQLTVTFSSLEVCLWTSSCLSTGYVEKLHHLGLMKQKWKLSIKYSWHGHPKHPCTLLHLCVCFTFLGLSAFLLHIAELPLTQNENQCPFKNILKFKCFDGARVLYMSLNFNKTTHFFFVSSLVLTWVKYSDLGISYFLLAVIQKKVVL